MKILEFKTSKDKYGDNRISNSIGGLVFLVTKVGENRMSSGGVIDLTGDEDPTDEDGDTRMDDSIGVLTSLGGEISLKEKKIWESNSDNTEGTIVGEAIEACSGGIVRGSRNIVGKVGGKSVLNFESRMVRRGHRAVNNPADPLPGDILGVTTLIHTGSHYPKTYWESLPEDGCTPIYSTNGLGEQGMSCGACKLLGAEVGESWWSVSADENPIRILEDYSKPRHEGYMNTINLFIGNNVVVTHGHLVIGKRLHVRVRGVRFGGGSEGLLAGTPEPTKNNLEGHVTLRNWRIKDSNCW
uniref:Uncharacterized protein n=1 Tax=Tanacetum cinerariifolium TaxID=118510 RepID=A0A6L2LDN9_TANCI|nr:hypothetical protein [Tanacetum cinerariifolium]